MPPQQGDGLLDIVYGAGDFGTHAGDIGISGRKVKLFQMGGPHTLRHARCRAMTS
jgi:hypothetical protein